MSQYTAKCTVVNGSSEAISGSLVYTCDQINTPISVQKLGSYACQGPVDLTVLSHHSDNWSWTPTNGVTTKLQKNIDNKKVPDVGVIVVITNEEIVVVTSNNGVHSKKLAS